MKRHLVLICSAIAFCGSLAALSSSPALAGTAPRISEISSWNVKSTTAGISMTYFNQNQTARVWFELSTHANLAGAEKVGEAVQPPLDYGRGAHAKLENLRPNTEYYFRAYARNSDGEAYSGISSFRTGSAGISPPTISFDNARLSGNSLDLEFTCNGRGSEGHCSAEWSTNANMSGARELKAMYLPLSKVGSTMYAKFGLSSVPDNTRIYVQGIVTTSTATVKTGVHDFVIRNKAI